jgi:hypothetical protein
VSAQTLAAASIRDFWPVFIVEWAQRRGGALCNSAKRLNGEIDAAATPLIGHSQMFETIWEQGREMKAGEAVI